MRPFAILPSWYPSPEMREALEEIQATVEIPPAYQIDLDQDPWPRYQLSGITLYAPEEHQAVKATLGIPAEHQTWEVSIVNPPGWHGYYFDLLGTLATPNDPPEYACAPRFRFYDGDVLLCTCTRKEQVDTKGTMTPTSILHEAHCALRNKAGASRKPSRTVLDVLDLQESEQGELIAWQRRVIDRQTLRWRKRQLHPTLWLEAQWHPATSVRLVVCHVEGQSPSKVAKFDAKSRQLLLKVERQGRPRGSGYYHDVEDVKTQIFTAIRKVHQQGFVPLRAE